MSDALTSDQKFAVERIVCRETDPLKRAVDIAEDLVRSIKLAENIDHKLGKLLEGQAETRVTVAALKEDVADLKAEVRDLRNWRDQELQARANRIASILSGIIRSPRVTLAIAGALASAWIFASGTWTFIHHIISELGRPH